MTEDRKEDYFSFVLIVLAGIFQLIYMLTLWIAIQFKWVTTVETVLAVSAVTTGNIIILALFSYRLVKKVDEVDHLRHKLDAEEGRRKSAEEASATAIQAASKAEGRLRDHEELIRAMAPSTEL